MATTTPRSVRSLVIYEIYVRSHGPHGTFADVEADLPRIRALGVDYVWFMPIHPIGKVARKGSMGSPYSITDYRAVNPEYGTIEDFTRLVEAAHGLGMKVMIDVVYNHTAHDAPLAVEHPDYYHQDANGRPFTTVPEWSDVIDLKHPNPGLTRYLIDSLLGWVRLGVDGFRCDVASIVPQEFWLQARQEVEAVKPGFLWLAESVHANFITSRRSRGLFAMSDSEVYAAFDLCYDYDIWPIFQKVVRGELPTGRYLELLRFQEAIYPANFAKMRCAENHDNPRIQRVAGTPEQALAWTAFAAFLPGPFLIYGGQESAAFHTPSLFEKEPVLWGDYTLSEPLARLAALKKDPAQMDGLLSILTDAPAIQAAWQNTDQGLYGVFNTGRVTSDVVVLLPDGQYPDLLNGGIVEVRGGHMMLPQSAAILRTKRLQGLSPWHCDLMV